MIAGGDREKVLEIPLASDPAAPRGAIRLGRSEHNTGGLIPVVRVYKGELASRPHPGPRVGLADDVWQVLVGHGAKVERYALRRPAVVFGKPRRHSVRRALRKRHTPWAFVHPPSHEG
jgi:hypothetical protein